MDTSTYSRILAGVRIALVLIGLIGNVITFIIFSRPVFEKNSISVYCRALVIADSFTFVNLIYDIGIAFFDINFVDHSDFACVLINYTGMIFGALNGWILITFSIDKLLNMKSIGNSLIKKRWFQYAVIISLFIFHVLLYLEVPIYLRLSSFDVSNMTLTFCSFSLMPFATLTISMYLLEGNIVPFIVIFTTSIISIRTIRKSSRNLMNSQLSLSNIRNKRDVKFAVTSITFNILFIVLRMPGMVLIVLSTYISSLSISGLELQLTLLLYFMNYSIGVIVHLVSNNLFRAEFFLLFRCEKTNANQNQYQSSGQSNSARNRK